LGRVGEWEGKVGGEGAHHFQGTRTRARARERERGRRVLEREKG
jgi:hypothetical protein